jgi:SAM-dependent methyltransferase
MRQTQAHSSHNPDLLRFIPKAARRLVEVGSSSGALAKAYKTAYPACHYIGIEIDPSFAELSRQYCDEVVCADIESMEQLAFERLFPSDCWIFGDTLEHLKDPWSTLRMVRQRLQPGGAVVACIPNAQHWSIQARLNCGLFQYEDSGLLDRTHLRWFTRITIVELFESSGFSIEDAFPRIFEEPDREKVFGAIRAMATCIGADPEMAVRDAVPFQWVIRAIPR